MAEYKLILKASEGTYGAGNQQVETEDLILIEENNSQELAAINSRIDDVENALGNIDTQVSVQNEQGNEQFKIDGTIQFEGVSFDAANKKVVVSGSVEKKALNTVFIDTSGGNDATAKIENHELPFRTLTAALAAMPSTNNDRKVQWTIEYLNSGNRTITVLPIRNLKISTGIQTGTLDFSSISGDVVDEAGITWQDYQPLEIYAPYSDIIAVNTTNDIQISKVNECKVIANDITINSPNNWGFFRLFNGDLHLECFNLTLGDIHERTIGLNNNHNAFVTIKNTLKFESNVTSEFSSSGIILNVNIIEKTGTGNVTIADDLDKALNGFPDDLFEIKVKYIIGAGTGILTLTRENTADILINLEGTLYSSSSFSLSLYNQPAQGSITRVIGAMHPDSNAVTQQTTSHTNNDLPTIVFDNFTGKISNWFRIFNNKWVFNNCTITVPNEFLKEARATTPYAELTLTGCNAFHQENTTNPLFYGAFGSEVLDIQKYGVLKTNATTLKSDHIVITDYTPNTY